MAKIWLERLPARMNICIYASMYICVNANMYICRFEHMYISMNVYMYINMYVNMHIDFNTVLRNVQFGAKKGGGVMRATVCMLPEMQHEDSFYLSRKQRQAEKWN